MKLRRADSLSHRLLAGTNYAIDALDTVYNRYKDLLENEKALSIKDLDINGYDLIKMIRAQDPHKPIIFASARDQDIDRVLGLELGGDDYISKPYSLRELMLRVKNILARTYRGEKSEVVKQGPYEIDLDSRRVTEGDKVVDLTSKEYDLLILLSKNQSQKALCNPIPPLIIAYFRELWGFLQNRHGVRLKKNYFRIYYRYRKLQ